MSEDKSELSSIKRDRMSYSREVLDSFITSGEAKIIGELPTLKKEAIINFQCKCGKEDTKVFVRIKLSGMYCKSCTKETTQKRREATNIKKYGTKCPLSNNRRRTLKN